MRYFIIITFGALALAGCGHYHEAAIPLGNDMMEIDVSTSASYGRAGAADLAFKKAADATVKAGYDKFMVTGNDAWTESTLVGGSLATANVNTYGGQANGTSFIGTARHPEVKMIIHMFHDGDEGSEKAVDARDILKQ